MDQLTLNFDSSFLKYHEENPHIYKEFKKRAFQAIQKGFKHYTANGIFEIIRWHTGIIGNDQYKVNHKYRAFYARLFAKEYPEHKEFFRTRKSKYDDVVNANK